jgi:hypothetical protein
VTQAIRTITSAAATIEQLTEARIAGAIAVFLISEGIRLTDYEKTPEAAEEALRQRQLLVDHLAPNESSEI